MSALLAPRAVAAAACLKAHQPIDRVGRAIKGVLSLTVGLHPRISRTAGGCARLPLRRAATHRNAPCCEAAQPTKGGSSGGGTLTLAVCRIEMARQVVVGAAFLLFPGKVFTTLHACCGAKTLVPLMRVSGVLHLTIGLATAYVLTEALTHGRLGSESYQRLLTGTACTLAAAATVVRVGSGSLPHLPRLLPHLAVGMAALCMLLADTGMSVGDAIGRMINLALAAPGKLVPINDKAGAFYAALAASVTGLGGVLLLQPQALPAHLLPNTYGPMGLFLKQQVGCGLLLTAFVAVTLKDACDRGRLGASTFRTLNKAVAAACSGTAGVVAYSAVTSPGGLCGMAAGALVVLALMGAVAGALSMQSK